jgi:hypothetical protein
VLAGGTEAHLAKTTRLAAGSYDNAASAATDTETTKTFEVVDSNHDYEESVLEYYRAIMLTGSERAFRVGTVKASSSSPQPSAKASLPSDPVEAGRQLSRDLCGVVPRAWLLRRFESLPGNVSGPVVPEPLTNPVFLIPGTAECFVEFRGTYSLLPCVESADGIDFQLFDLTLRSVWNPKKGGMKQTFQQWEKNILPQLKKVEGASILPTGDLSFTNGIVHPLSSKFVLEISALGGELPSNFTPLCSNLSSLFVTIADRVQAAVKALPRLPDSTRG